MPFIPNSDEDRKKMLEALGVSNIKDLITGVPEKYIIQDKWENEPGISERAALKYLSDLANKNVDDYICFLGGGAYDHYIPAAVNYVTSRAEFVTAYTPYQPEVSQGTLQSIYEYQTMICELSGMDISNASMYDGVSSTAEAVLLATAYRRRNKILIAENLPVNFQKVITTYGHGRGIEIIKVPCPDGTIDISALQELMTEETAGLVLQYPNYFGNIEPLEEISELIHSKDGLMIASVNPLALALLKSPGECGADIVTGEGQVFGNYMNWGGPYLGILAVKKPLMRKIPGRLSGRTVDMKGRQGFVLTLQTREQHIRREKATSNICTNQGLIALRACMHMALLGKEGVRDVAAQCVKKAHYLSENISEIPGFSLKYDKAFFHEFVVNCPVKAEHICEKLLERKIFAGIPLDDMGDPNGLLIAVTEKRTKNEMDLLVESFREFSK
ncbi:aminomethyl-transferring glycine dehydrogenase subunit GcvPA [candidate division KSB1 bacterium]